MVARKVKESQQGLALDRPSGAESKVVSLETGSEPGGEKQYNGLTISELTEELMKFVGEHGARYDAVEWNGTARLSLVTNDKERAVVFFSAMEELSKKYEFNVKLSGCLWAAASRNKIMNGDGDIKLDFTVPGKLRTGLV